MTLWEAAQRQNEVKAATPSNSVKYPMKHKLQITFLGGCN